MAPYHPKRALEVLFVLNLKQIFGVSAQGFPAEKYNFPWRKKHYIFFENFLIYSNYKLKKSKMVFYITILLQRIPEAVFKNCCVKGTVAWDFLV